MSWTQEQAKAIDLRDCNLLVSASAGSGKTAVLVERILKLVIEEELPLESFLVVTFTNAAAQEMRERIAKRLMAARQEFPQKRKFLSEQMQHIQQAQISTLHAFCKDVIQRHFYALDIDPNFKIGSQQTLEIKQEQALDEVMERAYRAIMTPSVDGEPQSYPLDSLEIACFLDHFGHHKTDEGIKNYIKRIYDFSRAHPYPQIWLEAALGTVKQADHLDRDPVISDIKKHIKLWTQALIDQLAWGISLCESPGGPVDYIETLNSDSVCLEAIMALDFDAAYEQYEHLINSLTFDRLKTIKKANKDLVDIDLAEQVKKIRSKVKADFGKLKQSYFSLSFAQYTADLKAMNGPMKGLMSLVEDYEQTYARLKREDGLVDFNDLEQLAIKALNEEGIAQAYRRKFSYVFIDEYQDSNRVQEEIAQLICGHNNRFLVGDVKQSIYRFRMAEPALFLEKFHLYPKDPQGARIDLNRNFRTHPDVLEGINAIFNTLMTLDFGGLDYLENGQLIAGREDFLGSAKPHLAIIVPAVAPDADDISQTSDGPTSASQDQGPLDSEGEGGLEGTELEAQLLGERIKAVLGTSFYDTHLKQWRNFKLSDIVVLMRSIRGRAQIFRDHLATMGIAVAIDEEDSYFEMVEVVTVINCLKLIDNFLQDIPLLGIMRSPIGNFSDAELAQIRLEGDKGLSYAQALLHFAGQERSVYLDKEWMLDLHDKAKSFIALFEEMRDKRYMPASELLWYVLERTGYWYFVMGLEDGAFRKQHLEVLMEKAQQFELERQSGLHHFVEFIDQMQKARVTYGGKANEKEQTSAVRIMSIHKSKGLEFPVVFLAGASKMFNLSDIRDRIIFHQKIGIASKYVDPKLRIQRDTLPYAYMKHMMREEAVAEEARILYVALTRAIYHLEVIATVKQIDSKAKSWQMQSSPYTLSQGTSYLHWIMTILIGQNVIPIDAFAGALAQTSQAAASHQPWTFSLHWGGGGLLVEPPKRQDLLTEFSHHMDAVEASPWISLELPDNSLPAKLSVTELKQEGKMDSVAYTPRLTAVTTSFEPPQEGILRGNAYHAFVEHMPLDQTPCERIIQDLIDKGLMVQEEADHLKIDELEALRTSHWYQSMMGSKRVWREQPFVYEKKFEKNQSTLVQGIIDAMFLDDQDQALVLIDYKSDKVFGSGGQSVLIDRYSGQLRLYKEAIEALMGLRVKAMLIYSFTLKEWIEVPLTQ